MSLGNKSSAFPRFEYPFSRKFDMSSTSGFVVEKLFEEFGQRLFDTSSASGCMGAKYVQEFCPILFDMSLESPRMGALPRDYLFTKQTRHTYIMVHPPSAPLSASFAR